MIKTRQLYCTLYQGADKSLARTGKKQGRQNVGDARDFNKIETRAVINSLFLQGKAPKEIHAILTETSDLYQFQTDYKLLIKFCCNCKSRIRNIKESSAVQYTAYDLFIGS